MLLNVEFSSRTCSVHLWIRPGVANVDLALKPVALPKYPLAPEVIT